MQNKKRNETMWEYKECFMELLIPDYFKKL